MGEISFTGPQKARGGNRWAIAIATLLLAVTATAWSASPAPAKFTIAVNDRYIGSALVLIASKNGYFTDAGLAVTFQRHGSGAGALDALLHGSAQLATTGEMPIVYAAFRGQRALVVATISVASGDNGVVARKESGIAQFSDLKGKRIGTISGTNGQYTLEAMLVAGRIRPAQVQLLMFKPEQLIGALAKGDVDAISAWEPFVTNAAGALGAGAVVFVAEPTLYRGTFNLVASPEFVLQNGEPLRRLLKALLRAERFIGEKPAEARRLVTAITSANAAEVERLWPNYDLAIRLEQDIITLLESQARWAIRRQFVERLEMPNFLDMIHLEAIVAVKPAAVSVIR